MNAAAIRNLVHSQIGDAWDATNDHGVDLRKSLVTPSLITVIERNVHDGRTVDRFTDAWLVLIECPQTNGGYRIIASKNGSEFGLASEGLPTDEHLVVCGWYGGFMDTFRGM
jgi:hypothetical protein